MLLLEWCCIYVPSFRSVAPMVFLVKIPFLAFPHYYGNHFPYFLAYVLSWIKTYHHAKFQRNSPTDLDWMMLQIYHTQRHLLLYIYRRIAAYSRSCPANVNMKHYRSNSNFGLVGPLISFWQPNPVGVADTNPHTSQHPHVVNNAHPIHWVDSICPISVWLVHKWVFGMHVIQCVAMTKPHLLTHPHVIRSFILNFSLVGRLISF